MNKTIESTDEAWEGGALGCDERFAGVSKLTTKEVGEAMNKRLDMSVLPEGFFIEIPHRYGFKDDEKSGCYVGVERLRPMRIRMASTYSDCSFRPALNNWHFNDGSMVLPDGLVVENWYRSNDRVVMSQYNSGEYCNHFSHWINDPEMCDGNREMNDTIAVKILGVTPEYAEHGKELGMEVIEL
jgi:hypothetical protein